MLCLITYCTVCFKETLCFSETTKDSLKCSNCIRDIFNEFYVPDDNRYDIGYDCD